MNSGDWNGDPGSNVSMYHHNVWGQTHDWHRVDSHVCCLQHCCWRLFLRWKYSPVDCKGGFYNFKEEEFNAVIATYSWYNQGKSIFR